VLLAARLVCGHHPERLAQDIGHEDVIPTFSILRHCIVPDIRFVAQILGSPRLF
jgi:hypothetical protein